MKTARLDQKYRVQPSLFDAPESPVVVPVVDQGKQSRNETYQAVVDKHHGDRSLWYTRIVTAGPRGVTLDELSAMYDTPANRISGRITELAELRLVVRTSERRETRASLPTRKITAAVIVATSYLSTGTPKPMATEYMPDQVTSARLPRDKSGNHIEAERTYLVSKRGMKSVRVRVFEADCELFCQEVWESGKPVGGSRPQRIDAMDSAACWEAV
jgi:hypothetical protein